MSEPTFTQLPDLAAEQVGGVAIFANDEFFAEKENLLKPGRGVFIVDKYTDRGKWMDGWETRRSRVPGYDWCLIKLGIPGLIHGFDVDTNHFLGNYPEHCSIESCSLSGDPSVDELLAARWVELLPKSRLQGGSRNFFACESRERWTHLRLNIYPDGGVARFRVHGEAAPDWSHLVEGELIDLAGIQNGGQVLICNDMFFSPKDNLILPRRAAHMGEGWETRRRREPGNDWLILRLGAPGYLREIEIDTAHFKGNYADLCSIDACLIHEPVPVDFLTSRSLQWTEILPPQKLQADQIQTFTDLQASDQLFSHLRVNIYPDGGISRLRVRGVLGRLARFNQRPLPMLREDLTRCCGSSEWVEQMLQGAPFDSEEQAYRLAEQVADTLSAEDWLEAFSHHPQIGDVDSLRQKFAATAQWASQEQAGSMGASEETLQALAAGNKTYLEKFGFIFIVCATGKSAAEMLTLLQERLENDPEKELGVAAGEQRKITRLRLEKLFA
ncbi:bifunctional allantoicase/OHCU decarboxylase [bacterium (Candidatus Blackallbacteria) CG17_big_fil_post_rev_8_21_14_2_50_48_46]|uniref:Probable allantoicase n=1 Tax=bacterium (Candidatus Blackallbacteria) CG17_big_fil_post_rev_8_21_14_2_50_48_46 TaxID=2014261 RepID=A0A2M7G282_9BACT|nr:MAG: bifunctional allantoicase/OHCU decarboxylase [bacterium (Candidatus Blackallbacteria) CG18_big_fil_WC_8_21_14_2_50_49_26]PIW15888.1 MAG: bifunctional allantoicase/OHCU decarboxylase [bacterium (Candidatus Blackallbacteria) CG17_big_fil_post_rev_8_21_14_2_50_48_46]PIW48647.1 MAG: bifunctional allantoicase/OHCU decarboxylase [bacterium (Candidatus Blackallbacteria) CG13_big_fil_rev_8_21_14_2_50_49_14]